MCKQPSISNKATAASSSGGSNSTALDSFIGALLLVYTIGFISFRGGELIPLVANYTLQCTSALIGTLVLGRDLSKRGRFLLRAMSMLALVYSMDNILSKPLPLPNDELYSSKTVVITGANSGVGYETSRQLAVDYGMQVIMGCRSKDKCRNAAQAINAEIIASTNTKISKNGSATPMTIDLSDLKSVKSFASQVKKHTRKNNSKVDVLFNNAGYGAGEETPVNQYGLDPAFSTMHLAHFYLTEELIKVNPSLRVVATSSGTHHFCVIPFTTWPYFIHKGIEWLLPKSLQSMVLPHKQNPGCIDEDYLTNGIYSATNGAAYIEAKLANVMHVVQIPKHHPKVTSVAIDLGWVGTNIQPWMKGSLSPARLGWMRSANRGVAPMINAIVDEELFNDLVDGEGKRKVLADAGFMLSVFGKPEEAFSYSWYNADGSFGDFRPERMVEMSDKLWKKSKELLKVNGF